MTTPDLHAAAEALRRSAQHHENVAEDEGYPPSVRALASDLRKTETVLADVLDAVAAEPTLAIPPGMPRQEAFTSGFMMGRALTRSTVAAALAPLGLAGDGEAAGGEQYEVAPRSWDPRDRIAAVIHRAQHHPVEDGDFCHDDLVLAHQLVDEDEYVATLRSALADVPSIPAPASPDAASGGEAG